MTGPPLTDEQIKQVEVDAPWLASTCASLLRQHPDDFISYLTTVCTGTAVENTRASVHCHLIGCDGNGRPRLNGLARAVADRIKDYCIPRSEIERAARIHREKNSTSEWSRLERKAKELFTHLAQSGEGGEMLLYVLVESMLRIPQLLCKMPLKTSKHVHYHGVDGIHGTVDKATGVLTLYWGESKLHADINQAVRDCFKSVAPFLLESGSSQAAQERDLQLLRDNLDLNDALLEKAIHRYLDPDDVQFKKLEFRAACLVGFDSDAYPTVPNTKVEAEVKAEIETVLDAWRGKVKNHVNKQKLNTFTIEVFCLPFPKVKDFRASFRKELGIS